MSVRGIGDTQDPVPASWAARWPQLARSVDLLPTEPVVLALSGGADSMFLLHVLAAARPRPRILAVHVDHRLRGAESLSDAAFCARQCARLSVPFARREVELDGDASNLEARAREARYRALADEARAAGIGTILTGHHEDDALETLLLRWMRGSALPGLAGLKARNVLRGASDPRADEPVTVVRPLLSMRREEVRRLLRDAGHGWCEDSTNRSARFTRNRVRHGLLPEIERACGEGGVDNLRAFASAVESLEEELAGRTAHLSWSLPPHASALRSARDAHVGGSLERARLEALAPPLLRRALWRLLSEGTRLPPSQGLLAILEDDIQRGRVTRRGLPGGWTLHLKTEKVLLTPPGGPATLPAQGRGATGMRAVRPGSASDSNRHGELQGPRASRTQPRSGGSATGGSLAEEALSGDGPSREGLRLGLPGRVTLADGRSIEATLVTLAGPAADPPRDAVLVELDAHDLPRALHVRTIQSGDRFHGLGAPGSRPLRRFLADCGIPAEERGRVPLVFAGDELIWVAGIRPCERRRLASATTRRLRLRLLDAAEAGLPGIH